MRAVAVLTVFANHLFDWPPGGFVGVDVFFVLSGFFITGILIRERTRTGRLSFERFYARRVKRILPSSLLVLAATVASGYLLFPAARARETLTDALYAAIFAANFRFEQVGADYFAQNQPPSPLQHYWSLSIEEQFYFVWPALLVGIYAFTRRWRRDPSLPQVVLFAAMGGIVATSFGWALFMAIGDANRAYFSTFTRIWELGVGALLAIAAPWLAGIPERARPLLVWAGLVGIAVSLVVIGPTTVWPAPWGLLPVLSTALVIAAFHGSQPRGVWLLTNPVARWFGDTSYTLYLWHFPVIILLMALLPEGIVYYVTVIAVSLGLTAVTYHKFEDPIRKSGWLTEPRWVRPSWLALLGAFLVSVVVVSLMNIYQDQELALMREDARAVIVDAPPPHVAIATPQQSAPNVIAPLTSPLPGNDPCFGAPAMLDNCELRRPDVPLTPSLETFTTDRRADGCWANRGERIKPCVKGYQGSDATRIALVGDSHAALLQVAIAPYLQAMKWQLTIYTGWSCSWHDPPSSTCRESIEEMERQMIEHPFDVVLTTSRRNADLNPDHYVAAWKPVAAASNKIVAVVDNPEVSDRALACLTRPSLGGGDRTAECVTPRRTALGGREPILAAARLAPEVTVIDLTQYYCDGNRCPAVIGDVIVYSDTNHVTVTYLRTLGPAIVDGIRYALERPGSS